MRYRPVSAILLTIALAQPALARRHARPPQPIEDPQSWFHTDDYPPAAMRKGEQGGVSVSLGIDTLGRVTDCHIDRSSGFTDLDMGTCQRIARRAHFQPATDPAGQPVAGTYKHTVDWHLPG